MHNRSINDERKLGKKYTDRKILFTKEHRKGKQKKLSSLFSYTLELDGGKRWKILEFLLFALSYTHCFVKSRTFL